MCVCGGGGVGEGTVGPGCVRGQMVTRWCVYSPEAIPTSCDMTGPSYYTCSPGVLLPNGLAIPTAFLPIMPPGSRLFISSWTPVGYYALPLVSQVMCFLQDGERKKGSLVDYLRTL